MLLLRLTEEKASIYYSIIMMTRKRFKIISSFLHNLLLLFTCKTVLCGNKMSKF